MRARLMFLAVMSLVTLAGCSGNPATGVATAGGQPPGGQAPAGAGPSAGTDHSRALQFAQCMRDHGIAMDDPEPATPIRFPKDGDPAALRAAYQACQPLAPGGGDRQQPDPQQLEQYRGFATCMREHGNPDFPDPSADGGKASWGGLDWDSPALSSGYAACGSRLGGSGT